MLRTSLLRPSSSLRPLLSLVAASLTLAPAVALACGGGVTTENATLEIAQHVAFYAVKEAGPTDVVVQLAVPRASEPFGIILPVRGAPDLDPEPVETSELRDLDVATAPLLVYEDDAGGSSSSSDAGCGCGDGDLAGGDLDGGAGGGGDRGVDVLEVADIGPVTAVSFAAEDAEALDTWLDENGFVIPDAARTTLEAYVDEGTTFIAFKRSDDAGAGATSVGVHFTVPDTYDDYPLRMAAVGAAAQLGIRVYLVTEEESGRGPTAPFAGLTIDDLRTDLIRDEGYTAAVAAAVKAAGGKAFLVEGVFPQGSSWRQSLGPRLLAMTTSASTMTRLTTVMERAALTEDVTFDTPIEFAPREIYLSAARLGRPRPGPVKWGSVGVFALGTATVLIRRRRRSRG